jgi:TolA-binding protein
MPLLRIFFISLFIIRGFYVSGQQTRIYSDPVSHYSKGLDLYDKQKYTAAISEFGLYLEKGKEEELLTVSRFYLAFCAIALENRDAEQMTLNLLEDYPGHPKANYARFLLGRLYYTKNNFTKAIEYLEASDPLGLSPEEANERSFNLAYARFSRSKYPEAANEWEKIKNNKDKYYYPTNYYLGYIAMMQEDDDRALAYFFLLAKSNVYKDKLPVYISRIFYRKGEFSNVISYTDTLEKKYFDADLEWERAKAFYQLGEFQQASEAFIRARGTREMSSEDKYMSGMSYYKIEDWENAYLSFTSISSDRDSLKQSALIFAADCFLKLDKKTNARNAFYEASRLDFDADLKELALFNYAKISLELPFRQDAVNNLKQFLDTYPASEYADEAKTLLSTALLHTRRYADAVPVLESIVRKSEETKKIYQEICYYYANELLSERRLDEAVVYFNKARTWPLNLKIDAQVDFWMGEILYGQGKTKEAYGSWKKFLDNPEAKNTSLYANAYYNIGYTCFDRQEYQEAAGYFKKYTEMETYAGDKKEKYIDGITRLGDCYYKLKNYNKAIEAYAYITSKDAPNSDYAYFQSGIIRGLQHLPEEKTQLLRKITEKYPSSEYVENALFEIALVHLQRQNYMEALRGLSFLLEDYPDGINSKKYYLNRGLVNYNLKRYPEALEDFKSVVAKYSKDEETQEAINAIKEIYNEEGRGEELIDYLKNEANQTLRISYEDSTIYAAALRPYLEKNCQAATMAFRNYIGRFPKAYFGTEARFYLAECLYLEKKYDEALDGYLYAIRENHPEFLERANRQAAAIYIWQEKHDLALPLLQQLERISSGKDNRIYAQVNQMYSYYRLKDYELARISAERVLGNEKAQKTDIRDANLIIGNVYMQQEDWKSARPYFEKVEKDKENKNVKGAEALYNLCVITYKTGELKKAQEMCFRLDEKYANQVYWVAKSYLLAAEIYLKQGDKFNARAILQSLLDNYPEKNDGITEEAENLMPEALE